MSAGPEVTFPIPGVLRIHLRAAEDSKYESLEPVAKEVERYAAHSKLVLIAEFENKVLTVDPRAIPRWIDILSRKDLKLIGAAIVTDSTLIRLATQSVGLGTRVRGSKFVVKWFRTFDDAFTWSADTVQGKTPS